MSFVAASSTIRIACVQAGDYADTRARFSRGDAETYGGQRYTVEAFEQFARDVPHLVVSLSAPPGILTDGLLHAAGVPKVTSRLVPRRVKHWLLARQVLRLLREYAPTHLLLRIDDVIGCEVLSWANARGIDSAVLLASRFRREHPPCLRFASLANDPNVRWVANHNRVAVASMIDCGLRAEKAIAWDYPATKTPTQLAPKTSPAAGARTLCFAGSVIEGKGVPELVEAVRWLRAKRPDLRLVILGDGDWRPTLLRDGGVREGWIEAPGSVPNDRVQREMRDAWLVAVPTRHGYPEALPLVITEGLCARTPVLLSDHPIFRSYFQDGAGVRFCVAGDAASLARVVDELWSDDAAYERLSMATAQAWQSVQVETKFDHLLTRLAREWSLPSAVSAAT